MGFLSFIMGYILGQSAGGCRSEPRRFRYVRRSRYGTPMDFVGALALCILCFIPFYMLVGKLQSLVDAGSVNIGAYSLAAFRSLLLMAYVVFSAISLLLHWARIGKKYHWKEKVYY